MAQTTFTITTSGTQAAADLATVLQDIGSGTDAATNTAYTITLTNAIYAGTAAVSLEPGSSVIFEGPYPFIVPALAVTGTITTDLNFTGTITLDGGVLDNVALATNGGGTIIAGLYTGGVLGTLDDGGDTAINAGTITDGGSYAAVEFDTGTVQNGWGGPATALISGVAGGVALLTGGLVQNGGTISANGTGSTGVFLGAGTVDNGQIGDVGALISGGANGVQITGAGIVVNDGTITGVTSDAVYLGSGSVANGQIGDVTALIDGGAADNGVWIGTGTGTVGNYGTITGGGASGVFLQDGGTLSNGSPIDTTALITGAVDGVVFGTLGMLFNYGTIDAVGSDATHQVIGAFLEAGGTVENLSTAASIGGREWGVIVEGGSGTVSNLGTIQATATSGLGVDLTAGGTVINGLTAGSAAVIAGVFDGVRISAGTLGAGAVVQNDGTISGSVGVDFGVGTTAATGTLTNDGLIESTSGTNGFAVVFGTGTETLVLQSAGTFIGGVLGNNANGSSTTLELATGTRGTLSAIGNDSGTVTDSAGSFAFSAIGTVHVDSGAGWTVSAPGTLDTLNNSGAVTLAGGLVQVSGTITNNGTLTNTGTLNVAGTHLAGAGSVVNNGLLNATSGTLDLAGSVTGTGTVGLGPGSTVRLDQTVGTNQAIAFATGTPETLILGTPGSALSNVVTGFVTGDRIELGGAITITAASFLSASMVRLTTTTGTYLLDDVVTGVGGVPNLLIGTDVSTGDSYIQAGTTLSSPPPQTDVWAGSNGTFGLASNWNDVTTSTVAAAAPGTNDTAQFLSGDGVITGADTVSVLQFGSGGVWSFGIATTLTATTSITVGNGIVGIGAGATIAGKGSLDTISGTSGGNAQVRVAGTGAEWTDAGTLLLGGTGVGNLSIATGGTAISGAATIANTASASGSSASVTGTNAAWTIGGTLAIGVSGSGSLNIAAGGTVTAGSLITASTTAGSAVLSVSGTLSALNATGDLIIGGSGNADLDVTGGATIGAGTLDIGLLAGSSGVVDVEGASALFVTGTLNIGDAGNAVLSTGADVLVAAGAINIGTAGVFIQFGDPTLTGVFTNSNSLQVASGTNYITATVEFVNDGPIIIEMGALETITTPLLIGTGSIEINPTGELILNAGSVVGTQSIVFEGTSGGGTLQIGAGDIGQFGATVTAFQAGDEIILAGTSVASVGFVGNVATLFGSGGGQIGTLAFAGGAVSGGYLTASNGVLTEVACFAEGTRLATVRGEVAVEALREGDLVRTVLGGNEAAITWIGRRTVDCARHPQPRQVWPVRVRAGAFGAETPRRDLYLSPDHAVYVNEVLVPVRHLVNGTSIAQVMVDSVTYYHVELPAHDVVLAEGLAAESYLDMKDGSNYAKTPGPVVLYPDRAARMWEAFACAPLVVSGPELVAARAMINRMQRAAA